MRALAIAIALLAGCDDGTNVLDGGAGDGGADLSASVDGAADLSLPVDLAPLDATCALQRFTGFFVGNPTLQKLDCTCGCIIDTFESNIVSGYWGKPTTGNATYAPMPGVGLGLTLATPDGGGASVAALNSLSSVEPFYLDGDFDLLVDYSVGGPLPDDAHVLLTVQDASPTGHYSIERERTAAGGDDYAARLGGLPNPVTISTTATSGTLELQRNGAAIKAIADGAAVSQFTGAGTARVQLILSGALASCAGTGCQFTVVFHNARMTRGALVDRP